MARDDRNRNRGRQGSPEIKVGNVRGYEITKVTLADGQERWSVLLTAEVTVGRGKGVPAERETIRFIVDGTEIEADATLRGGRASLKVTIPYVEGVDGAMVQARVAGTNTYSSEVVIGLREALPKVEIKISPPGEPVRTNDGWEVTVVANVSKDGNVFGGAEVVFYMGTEIVSETSTNSDGRTSTVIRIPTGTRRASIEAHVVGHGVDSVIVDVPIPDYNLTLNLGTVVATGDQWEVPVTVGASENGNVLRGTEILFSVEGNQVLRERTDRYGCVEAVVGGSLGPRHANVRVQITGTPTTAHAVVELPVLAPKVPALCRVERSGGRDGWYSMTATVTTEDGVPVEDVQVLFLDYSTADLLGEKTTDQNGRVSFEHRVSYDMELALKVEVPALHGDQPKLIRLVGVRTRDESDGPVLPFEYLPRLTGDPTDPPGGDRWSTFREAWARKRDH